MSTKETGGPAYPTTNYQTMAPLATGYTEGMSLRDYFAAKALPGLMGRDWSHHKGTDIELIKVWSMSAYAVADAMMEARK